jgi:DNA-binding beta-propeller fold protein YncE
LTAHEAGAVQNPPPTDCCVPAPSVLEFDQEGNLLQAWGGPTWDQQAASWIEPPDGWPEGEHGIFVDHEDNVWIGGNGPNDHVVLKFSRGGKRLLTLGQWRETRGSNDHTHLGRPADMFVDASSNEVYIADGYGNRRVVVFDATTGAYKRHWGAYGHAPDDALALGDYDPATAPDPSFRSPVHAVRISNDGLVYVADRAGNRIQVFQKDGGFVTEGLFGAWTLLQGSAWDLEFSGDPDQTWVFVADGANMKIWILRRSTLEVAGSFGRGGRQAGQFNWVHNLTADSRGNIYTAEVNTGKRVQKFRLQNGT